MARERRLRLYGPSGLRKLCGDPAAPVMGRLPFEVQLRELRAGRRAAGRRATRIAAFDVDHAVPALGYALVEDERPGRFDEARARELGVQPGPDFGRLQGGEAVGDVSPEQVVGAPRPGRTWSSPATAPRAT